MRVASGDDGSIRHALIDTGEIGALGEADQGGAWTLGVRDPRRPKGELVVEDTTQRNDADPAFDDLGARFRVTYVDAAELGR